MSNHTTGAQRYNNRMDKIFDRAKNEGRGLNGNSHQKGVGVNSPAMMEAREKFKKPISKVLKREIGEKKYITAPSGRKFEITESKSRGHQNIDYKNK